MFNPKKFESKVYALVTREVNKAFTKLSDSSKDQTKGIQFHQQIMQALHGVTEETATQILYGLLLSAQVQSKKAKPDLP